MKYKSWYLTIQIHLKHGTPICLQPAEESSLLETICQCASIHYRPHRRLRRCGASLHPDRPQSREGHERRERLDLGISWTLPGWSAFRLDHRGRSARRLFTTATRRLPCAVGVHQPGAAPPPPGEPSRGAREVDSRERALEVSPIGTVVGRIFTNSEGNSKTFKATVYDLSLIHI